jgi:hypothetical protein
MADKILPVLATERSGMSMCECNIYRFSYALEIGTDPHHIRRAPDSGYVLLYR